MKICITANTDVGCQRENNEDAVAICPDLGNPDWSSDRTQGYVTLGDTGTLIVVADGMGGAKAGEVASSTAIDTVRQIFTTETARQAIDDATEDILLTKAVLECDKAIDRQMIIQPETEGMGTTIVLCWLTRHKAHIAWCGDSRCYRFSDDDGLQQITKDHSYVQELIDKGIITEKEAFHHPDNNLITRVLGGNDDVTTPDVAVCDVKAGDTILLCSDGLCGYCDNKKIERVLRNGGHDPLRTADSLMRLALRTGGEDNISVAVATLIDDDDPEPSPSKFRGFLSNIFG